MGPVLTKAEFTASQRSKTCVAKRTQKEKICQERKGKRDAVTSSTLKQQQRAAAAYFKPARKKLPFAEVPPDR